MIQLTNWLYLAPSFLYDGDVSVYFQFIIRF